MFDSTKGALLVAPSLANSSCWLNGKGWPSTFPAPSDILKAFFIFALSMAIVLGNLVLICVLNNRRYIKYIDNQGALLVAPSLAISSCWLNGKGWPSIFPAPSDILKAFFIFALSMAIVLRNLVLICMLNNRRYIKYIDNQGALLVAPSLAISSCWLNGKGWPSIFPAPSDILKAFFIFALSMAIVLRNLVLICMLNNRRYIKYIDNQPRYLLTSLALNDLFTGILVAPVALLPALYKCWPYGEIFCQIQALLRGAVSQQSAVILVCMAIDRYLYLLHPSTYHKHSSKKGCVLVISITWILSVSLFAIMVLPRSGYYFNSTGLMACDVFHSRVAFRILSCCAYYFPTTMALMYCYGSGFHISKTRSKCEVEPGRPNGVPVPCAKNSHSDEVVIQAPVRPHSVSTSRTMAAMSLGFIVMVTPATIQEVVAACTGCKVPPSLDFIVTWLALSNSFWNPFLYWLLNSHFRRISHELLQFYICCRRPKSFQSYEKPTGCCSSPVTSDGLHSKGEFEGLGEKYWGEILERTVSSTSLHAIQKACHRDPLRCSGSFKGCHNNYKQDPRYFDGYGPTDYRHLDRAAFQIESCSRQCRLKNSDICLFRPTPGLECGRSRSNLSLDEGNFTKVCNGRHPDL